MEEFTIRIEAVKNSTGKVMVRYEYPDLDRADLLEVEEALLETFGLSMLEKGVQIAERKGDVPAEKLASIKQRMAQKKRMMISGPPA